MLISLAGTKGFAAKNAIGRDVVKLLQDAFDRKHMHVKCIALINDVSWRLLRILHVPSCFVDCRRDALARIQYRGLSARR
jgi:hypothetical protein